MHISRMLYICIYIVYPCVKHIKYVYIHIQLHGFGHYYHSLWPSPSDRPKTSRQMQPLLGDGTVGLESRGSRGPGRRAMVEDVGMITSYMFLYIYIYIV